MRGHLRVTEKAVKVTGYLSWSALLFTVSFAFWLVIPGQLAPLADGVTPGAAVSVLIAVWLCVVQCAIYVIQARGYEAVGRYLTGE
jgi:hypothetical protein